MGGRTPCPAPLLASERRWVITNLVRAMSSLLGLQMRPAAPTATRQHQQPMLLHPPNIRTSQSQQPMLVHPPNIRSSQSQPPQVYYHVQAPPLPSRQNSLLPGLRPSTSRAELTSVPTPRRTVFPQPPARRSEVREDD